MDSPPSEAPNGVHRPPDPAHKKRRSTEAPENGGQPRAKRSNNGNGGQEDLMHFSDTVVHLRNQFYNTNSALLLANRDLAASQEREATIRSEFQALQEKMQKKEDYCSMMQKWVHELHDKLDKEEGAYEKITDQTIREQWEGLYVDISQFSLATIEDKTRRIKIKPKFDGCDDKDTMARVVELYHGQPWLKPFLVQRYIWSKLTRGIFIPNTSGIWAGEVGEKFMFFLRAMQETEKQDASHRSTYSAIKSRTAHELDAMFGLDESAMQSLWRALWADLQILIPPSKGDGMKKALPGIVKQAAALQVIFLKSKALFKVELPSKDKDPMVPNEDEMEVYYTRGEPAHDERHVHMFISPRLEKTGNADGYEESFGKSIIICKPRVVVA